MKRICITSLTLIALSVPGPAMAQPVAVVAAAESDRVVPMEGGRNFRDAGGYRTEDGRTVRKGVFYRSGTLGSLTVNGQQKLSSMGIGAIIDLRSSDERSQDMNNWLAASDLGYWARDYRLAFGDLAKLFGQPDKLTAETVRAAMAQGYRTVIKDQAPSFRQLFARLAASGDKAVVVNCTAGKDRTGVAVALVLTALGVPYDRVREDFLLSNAAISQQTFASGASGPMAALPPEVLHALAGVEGEYLDAAFDQIRKDHGTVEAYLETELGVGPLQIAALKRRMLV